MKKTTHFLLSLVAMVFMTFSGFGQATDLIISEYIEGSSNNKALELYNGTGAAVDLAGYEIWRISNGGDWPEFTYPLSGTLADGDVFVIANSSAGPEITAVADMTSGATWFNGDDAVGLAKDIGGTMTLIDAVGEDGPDVGTAWDVAGVTNGTKEHTLVRKADICSPTTDWAVSAGTNTTDSQWIVYDQDEFGYIGAHTSSCGGGPIPLDANFSADQTFVAAGTTVNFTDLTGGGETPYSYSWDLDGDGTEDATSQNPSFQYNTVGTYTVTLEVTDNLSTVDTETKTDYITVYVTTAVNDIATLRAGTIGDYYTLSNEVTLTFQQSYRGQKYIEDATAAILIDDNGGIISTIYALGDGITGISGTLGEYGGMMQFIPLSDPGTATSSGNVITPQTITLNELTTNFEDYEAELVEIIDIAFADAGSTFVNGTVYGISDASKAAANFRTTFYGVDYIGGIIPAVASIVGLPNSRSDGDYITSRDLADFTTASNPATQLAVTLVNGGNDPYTNTNFEVVVQAQDAGGLPANVSGDVNFTFTTDGGDLGTVGFVGGTTISGTILDGTYEVTLTGVQMAPEGTNVTITATDDVPFGGLTAGTSAAFDVIDFTLPAIIITEIMQNPDSVSDANGEWFEVYNNSATPVDMMGWTIKDDGTNSHVIASTLIVPANGFAVLGIKSDPLINGGYTCDYQYSGFALGNGEDEVILILPDGTTEVDRVEYDGGPVWPNPHGASMVFTGFIGDDNNDGTLWGMSAFRESTYPSGPQDNGSPGTDGYSQIFDGGFKLDLKVLLEGPYVANDSMANGLRVAGAMPYEQPFNPTLPYYGNNTPAWLYSGTENLSHLPFYAIDWVLIELRDATSAANATSATMVAQYPAFVMEDGTVVSLNGTHALNINHIFINNMYIVVWHRNHLGIMNPSGLNPVFGTTESYDFSTGSGQVYGGAAGYTELSTGIWGMVSGDSNGDQVINDTDKTTAWDSEAGEAGYKGYDLNLNGEINNVDKNDFWVPNNPTSSQVPN